MLQLELKMFNWPYKFFRDDRFIQIQNTIDNVMKELSKEGIGAEKKQAEIISIEEEKKLWDDCILGVDTPDKLVNTLLYVIDLNFALRGGEEHRNLCHGPNSQLKILINSNGKKSLQYIESSSKCNQGGLKDMNKKKKCWKVQESEASEVRCPIYIYEKYISHCPKPLEDVSGFYLRPLCSPKGDIWFARQPMGRHKLSNVVKEKCARGKLSGYRTNHSLRSTAATRLYEAEVDEQLITEITGHTSNAVRNYKRTSDAKRQKMSSIVQGLDLTSIV